jgi:hypothetical protein
MVIPVALEATNGSKIGGVALHQQRNRVKVLELERFSVWMIAVRTIGDHRQLIGGGRLLQLMT